MSKVLYLIPARGGSKGIPGKNIKSLSGKPLIYYTIDVARQLTSDDFICVSTDDDEILAVVEDYGLKVPFIRPGNLASDKSGTYEVILHALDYYEKIGISFDCVVLLQPTSPFRKAQHVKDGLNMYAQNEIVDMVVSVTESDENPYYTLFEESEAGYLVKSKPSNYITRQDCPAVYKYNGAVYVINTASLQKYNSLGEMKYIKKVMMDKVSSVDIDEPIDWLFCEMLIANDIVKIN